MNLKVLDGSASVYVRGKTSDVSLFGSIFVEEEYKCPDDVSILYDLGANVGYASVYFAHFHPNVGIVAYDPDAENFVQLEKNTRNLKNVKCMPKGIWWKTCNIEVIKADVEAFQFQEVEEGGVEVDGIMDVIGQPSSDEFVSFLSEHEILDLLVNGENFVIKFFKNLKVVFILTVIFYGL